MWFCNMSQSVKYSYSVLNFFLLAFKKNYYLLYTHNNRENYASTQELPLTLEHFEGRESNPSSSYQKLLLTDDLNSYTWEVSVSLEKEKPIGYR